MTLEGYADQIGRMNAQQLIRFAMGLQVGLRNYRAQTHTELYALTEILDLALDIDQGGDRAARDIAGAGDPKCALAILGPLGTQVGICALKLGHGDVCKLADGRSAADLLDTHSERLDAARGAKSGSE